MSEHAVPLEDLSGWTLPPASVGDTGPVRVFDTRSTRRWRFPGRCATWLRTHSGRVRWPP